MASKRTFNEEDDEGNNDRDLQVPTKRRHGDPQQAEAMNLSVLPNLEVVKSLFRNVMEEVIPPMLQRYIPPCCCRLSQNQAGGTSGGRGRAMQLCFVNSLPPKNFTFTNLRAENGGPLQIELRYAGSQQRVVTEEYSTMKVQICVLDGDFGTDGIEDWTEEEFKDQIMKPREGKGALLKGEIVIKLEKGLASIDNKIVITDNSCSARNRKFRLGVKFVQSNNSVRIDIKEGRSNAFKVLDKRGEKNKKHDRPALDDEVWRLKNVGKGGPLHRKLLEEGIQNVKDLLRLNTIGSLREKFANINTNMWDKIIEHAKDCEVDDDERYIYHAKDQSLSLVLNCIYEVVEVKFYGQNWGSSLESLSSEEKRLVERVKQVAYQNLKDLVPIETAPHDIVKSMTDTQVAPYGAPYQDQPVTLPAYNQPFISASCTYQGVHDPLPGKREMGQNSLGLDGIFSGMDIDVAGWDINSLLVPLVQGGCSIENESSQIQFTHGCPPYATLESEPDFLVGSPDGAEIGNYSGNPNFKAVWYKIHVALKLVILVKRKAAARKAVLPCGY